jgi:TP901 family phage tail tape measure protein
MSDVNANIGVHIDTSSALAELKNLQRQLANFHASIAKTSAAATVAQRTLQTNLLNSINATGQFSATMGTVRSSTESFTHALESNKLSMREYFRYAGGASRTFGRLFKQEFDTIGKVAEERVKKMQTQYIKMGRDASGAIKAMAITPQTLNMNDYATKTALAAQKQALFNQIVRQGSTSLLNFGKNTQWAGRQLMVGFTIPLAYFGTTASKVFMDLEAQAIKFKRVYGDMFTTADETNKALAEVEALAEGFTKYGVAVSKTMEMAAAAAAMGKTGADLTAQVSEATRLAVLGGVEQQQALETTISLTNAFGIASEDLAKKIDFLNSVENQTVVSIEDLTIAIPKAGPVVQQLGGDVEDLAFFLTAMKEGGINASEGANALKSGLASLINPSKKAAAMLNDLGINIKGIVEGNAGNVRNTVIQFSQALDTLDPLNRARAIEQLFGKFQFSRLSTLFQNVTKDGTQASKVLRLAGASVEELAILSERELKTVENAVGVQFKSAVEELKLAIAPIGKTFLQAITPIVKVIGDLLEKFNGLGDGTKKFIVIASTLVGIIGPTLLMTFGLVANGVANIIKLFLALRGGFLRLGGNSKILAEQTSYLNAEQLESATVAASLNQAHTRLTQSFTAESAAVRALRQAYIEATIAAANFARANPGMMVPGGGKVPKKFARGATYVPGTGNKDTVPSMLTPGEAVIPAGVAQDPRFQPIIDAMVNGDLQGFEEGTVNVGSKSFKTKSQRTARDLERTIAELRSQGIPEEKIIAALERNLERGRPMNATQLKRRLSIGRGSSSGSSAPSSIRALAKQSQSGFLQETEVVKRALKEQGVVLTPAQEKNLFNVQASHIEETRTGGVKEWKANNLVADLGYVNNYINTVKGKLGTDLLKLSDAKLQELGIDRKELQRLQGGTHPTTAEAARTLRAIAAYDITRNPASYQARAVVAGLDHRSKTGFYAQPMKTLADTKPVSSRAERAVKSRVDLLEQEKNAKAGNDSQQIMKQIDRDIRKTALGQQPPTNFGTQVSPTTGHSFPVKGLGGVYQKPDGTMVFVKPVIDAKAALAEQRATMIARDVHGLDAPKQEIRTMIDPTDPTGKRKLIVLESLFDPKFDPSRMTGTFTKDEYFRQLVAANLRGDKDLGRGNLSGNVLADVGTAGVFEKASGKRDFAKTMPSMAEQARINLLGVKGGAKRFFAESTLDIPKGMTADEYHSRMIKEIDRVLPKLRETIARLDLTPQERTVYSGMITRLEEGRKVDWREFHKMHSSVLVTKKEALQDKKTGRITPIKGKPKPKRAVSSSGKASDSVITQVPPGKRVVQKPKGFVSSRLAGKFTLPGYADAPPATGTTVGDISQSQRLSRAQLLAATERISLKQAKKRIAAEEKLFRAMQETTAAQKTTKEKLTAFSNKAGIGIGALSGLTIAASFTGGKLGEMAQTIMPFVFGIQGLVMLLPLLANPWVAAIAAIALVGGVMWKLARDVENARKEGVNLAKAMSMTSDKLQSLSKVTGTVSATEEADRKRQNTLTGESEVQRKFGQNILGSEFGKSLLADIEKQASSGQGIQEIGRNISNSLAYAIVQGTITTDQAKSIASALGEELKNYEIPAIISGRLTTLLGPNGENLATDPLQVTLAIQEDSMTRQADFFKTALEQSVSTTTFTNFGQVIGGSIVAAIGSAILVSTGFTGVGAVGGGAIAAAGGTMVGKGLSDQNKRKEVNANLGAAALQLGLEQVTMNNGLVDSLNKQYDIKLKTAKTDAEIKTIEDERKKALDTLNAKNSEALGILVAQKDAFGPDIFTKGINAAIDTLYKDGPMKVFADEAKKELEGIGDADFKAMLQVQFASGSLDPVTVVKLANNEVLQSKFSLLVETEGSEDANLIMQLLLKAGADDTNLPIFMDILNNDPKNFDKNLNAIKVLANMKQKYGITINVNDDGATQVKEVAAITEKLAGITGEELTKEAFLDLGITGDMTGPEFDALWKTLVGTSKTINKSVIVDFVAAGDVNVVDAYMTAMGITAPKGRLGAMKRNALKDDAAAWAVGRQGKVDKNGNPIDDNNDDVTTKSRNTTFDSILQGLKNTRDATIDAQGGAKELMRILGDKKDLQLFNGLDQQLSKLGANSDFIDFVGGLENAVKEKIIKINAKGVVSYGEFGAAAKKAFDEQQLGAFSSKSAIAIKELQGQRSGFVALKSAGVESADAVEMLADATFMVSLAAQKNPAEIKKMIDEWKIMKKELDLTTAATNPQQYFNNQMSIAERQFSFQEAMARRTYEPQIAATEELVKANNVLIEQSQRKLEMDSKYGSRQIDRINSEIDALNRELATGIDAQLQQLSAESNKLSEDQTTIAATVDGINEKYDLQEKALSKISDLNQEIIAEKKTQISLADALTQGDISAAAQAAQDVRSASADKAQKLASDALDAARESQIAGVTGSITGMTAKQIADRQYKIDRQNYSLGLQRAGIEAQIAAKQEEIYKINLLRKPIIEEITKLEDANYDYTNKTIPALKAKLDQELASIESQRGKWKDAQLAIEGANLKTKEFQDKLTAADGTLVSISKLWGSITDKNLKVTISTIEEVIKQQASFVKTGTVQTKEGPVDVDSSGRAADGSIPIAVSKPDATDKTTTYNQQREAQIKKEAADAAAAAATAASIRARKIADYRANNAWVRSMPDSVVAGILGLAKGGVVPSGFTEGKFAKGTDTVPAMLTPGEYVLRRDAVQKYGVEQLDAMNVGMYSDGGEVSKFGSRPKYGTKPEPKKNWFQNYVENLTNSQKAAAKMLPSFMSINGKADALGAGAILRKLAGQGEAGDTFSAALFPLNFLGMGKVAGDGVTASAPIVKQSSGILSKIIKQTKGLGSKIATPFQELFAPAATDTFNFKNSFLSGLQTGKSRIGQVIDTKAVNTIKKQTEPLIAKLDEAGYEPVIPGSDTWIRKGTGNLPYNAYNALQEGHPLYDTLIALTKAKYSLPTQKQAKNVGYYASVLGAFVKKTKDAISTKFPGLERFVTGLGSSLPGQVSQKSLQIGEALQQGERGINSTFRAVLDGVPGFYKTGIDFAEVKREIFGGLFAGAAKLVSPRNIPVVGTGKAIADGIFSPDIAAQGAATLKSLGGLDQYGFPQAFDKTKDAATAASSGYRSAIMAALRFVDDHDGNLVLNPDTLAPGLIDFGRVLDWTPFPPNIDTMASEIARPLFGANKNSWKNPELTSAFFSGIDKGTEFLSTLKQKDITKLLKEAGYKGKELKEKTAYMLDSIKTALAAVPEAKATSDFKQELFNRARTSMPPIPGVPEVASTAASLGGKGLEFLQNSAPVIDRISKASLTKAVAKVAAGVGLSGLSLSSMSDSKKPIIKPPSDRRTGGVGNMLALASGGMVPKYFSQGGYSVGTDTIPAMLTPGEFVINKNAADGIGVRNLNKLNSGESLGSSVYNYSVGINVTNANADANDIARAVMGQIKYIDSQRIRGQR